MKNQFESTLRLRTGKISTDTKEFEIVQYLKESLSISELEIIIKKLGITAVEFGKIIRDHFLLAPNIRGLYNIGSNKINKYDLLKKFAKFYGKNIKIDKNLKVVIDRSLNTANFRKQFNYHEKSWEKMLSEL